MNELRAKIRELGYQIATKEIYGENTFEYFELKQLHNRLLARLYRMEKRNE
jgi:hypothetical protein